MNHQISRRFAKKNRDLSRIMVSEHQRSFFDQIATSHAHKGLQRIANTLSTEAPTEIGGNFASSVEKALNTRLAGRFIWTKAQDDQLLINSLKAAFYKALSGWQTSYPQKRQQRLGATQLVTTQKNPLKTAAYPGCFLI